MRISRQYSGKLLLPLVLLLVLPALNWQTDAYAQTGSRTFPETGKTVRGRFLAYWNERGGLPQQGFPISNEMQEKSDTDGKTYTVQYFERAVFELHPENRAPNDVLLSLLGVFEYGRKYPNGAPGQKTNTSAGSVLFPETGKRVGGRFLTYWQEHGGLAQQGYPLSDEFVEKSPLDGKTYTVQYFERAVFELHPENRPPFDVLLSQLGTFRYQTKYGAQAAGGRIVYLASDGVTVKSTKPDGSNSQTLATITKKADELVDSLTVDPTGTSFVYSLAPVDTSRLPMHYLLQNGQSTPLVSLASTPRWSPDGTQFVARTFGQDSIGAIYLYDVARKQGRTLNAQGEPDWFPDGKRLVYATLTNVFSYDLATNASTQLSRLPETEENQWVVDEAHVLPKGDRILFFGAVETENGVGMLGPHGEGQQWWSIPASGGQQQAWGDPLGQAVSYYATAPQGSYVAFGLTTYGGAFCGSYDAVAVMDTSDSRLPVELTAAAGLDEQTNRYTLARGLSWSPDGTQLAYGVERHTCAEENVAPTSMPSEIYIWPETLRLGGESPVGKLADGMFPTWLSK